MDRAALRTELERLHPESFGWAMGCVGHDAGRAEEVLQTVYLKIFEGRARFAGRSAFRTWLFAVIRNTAADAARRDRRRRLRLMPLFGRADPPSVAPAPDAVAHRHREAARLRAALARLPTRQREVLLLTFYHDATLREAAEVMGVSLGTARQHYHRGKKRLRQWLSEPDPEATPEADHDPQRPDPAASLSGPPRRR